MAKETKEERAEGERRRREIAERAQAAFRLTLPKRMMDAQALATTLGLSVNISLTPIGPSMSIFSDDRNDDFFEGEINYESEEWQVDHLDESLQRRKEKKEAAEARLALAKTVFAKLTQEEKDALKEFIHYCR